jgi:hypothetical protein
MGGTWSTTDTVATIAAVAQVSAAIFTGVMAKRTHGLATETRQMAEETKRIADATDLQAKATEALVSEAQLDREVSWSPYLTRNVITTTINTSGTPGSPKGYSEQITLSNLGGGQAMSCYYVSRRSTDNYWCWLRHDGLTGGESVPDLPVSPGDGDPPWELLQPSPLDPDQNARLVGALFCEDVFGNRIRFPIGRRGRDVSRPEDGHRPAWATSPLVWPG